MKCTQMDHGKMYFSFAMHMLYCLFNYLITVVCGRLKDDGGRSQVRWLRKLGEMIQRNHCGARDVHRPCFFSAHSYLQMR